MNDIDLVKKRIEDALDAKERDQMGMFIHALMAETISPAMVSMIKPVLDKMSKQIEEQTRMLREEIRNVKIDLKPTILPPTVNIPEITIPKAPDIHIPPITVPEPKVNVKVPAIKVPKPEVTVKVQENVKVLNALNEIKAAIEGMDFSVPEGERYTASNPQPVQLVDMEGKPYMAMGSNSPAASIIRWMDGDTPRPVSAASPLPTTASLSLGTGDSFQVRQTSGFTDSVNVVDAFGSTAVGSVFNADNRLRVSVETEAKPLPVSLYASDATALAHSGGNLLVNVQNFAVGQYGNADNTAANLTSGLVFAEMLVYDGTTWDRLRGDATDGALVNLGANNDVVPGGNVADDAGDSGNPLKVGAKVKNFDNTDPGSVSAEDDRADLTADRSRRLYTNTAHAFGFRANENHSSAQTNNALVSAPGANMALFITDIIISNGATAGSVQIVEDTGGTPATLLGPYYLPITGGMSKKFQQPIKVTTNKDIGFTSTTVTTHTVTVVGFTAPI